jgi:ribosomal protein S18 acetylase RimI-like enzyme
MVVIRRAVTADIAGIRAVLAATWRDTYALFMPEATIEKVTEAEVIRPSAYTGVATSSSNEVVGMISAHSQGEVLHVSRVYVLPEFQRRGIGGRLMNEACRIFPEARRLHLEVEEQNSKGRAFYRKLGFRQVETRCQEVAGTRLSVVVLERPVAEAAP